MTTPTPAASGNLFSRLPINRSRLLAFAIAAVAYAVAVGGALFVRAGRRRR